MIIFLIILILLFGFLMWLLLAPIRLNVDSTKNRYQISWKGFGNLTLIPSEEEWFLNLKIGFWRKQLFFSNIIEKLKTSEQPSTIAKTKKTKKKKKLLKTWKQIRNVANTFKVKAFKVNLDTDDYYLNALLFPVFNLFNRGGQHRIAINFQNRNDILLSIENRLGRIIYSILF